MYHRAPGPDVRQELTTWKVLQEAMLALEGGGKSPVVEEQGAFWEEEQKESFCDWSTE